MRTCQVGLHGAGRTPNATHEVELPVGDKHGWVPACWKCVSLLAEDARRDGLSVARRTARRK